MRIGIDALFIRPGINGGTETYTREMIRALGELGTDDEFIVYGVYPELGAWCSPYRNFRFVRIALGRSVPVRILYEQTVFVRRVKLDSIDVLFCPGYVSPLWGSFPVVTTIHDMLAYVYPQHLTKARTLYWRTMLPLTMRRSSRIITVSANTADDVRRYLPAHAGKVRIIKEAADARFCPANAGQETPSTAKPHAFLLAVSTLQPMKNVRNLLLGYADARQKHGLNADLVLVGRDAMGTVTSMAREFGIADRVRLTGFLPFAQLLHYYHSAVAFVSASLYEGFGLPVLEAMKCGCPVACSRTSIFQEVAGDAALYFEPLDKQEIGRCLAEIANDEGLRNRLRHKGLERAAGFSWKRAAEQLCDTLHSLSPKQAATTAAKPEDHGQFPTDERLLMLALAGGQPDPRALAALYSELGDERAWAVATEHEMAGHVAHKLADSGIEVPNRWRAAHEDVAQRIGSYMHELDRVARLLAADGIQVVALKNAGITRGSFCCMGCSPMGDVDLLVRRSDFAKAHNLLLGLGYVCASRNPFETGSIEEGCFSGGTEYWLELENTGKSWLELQWRPVAGRWLRPDQEPSGDELMARSVAIKGTPVRLLCPEDNLLQVCLHTAKHSYVRAPGFRLHSDVDRIVRGTAINWTSFVNTVERLEVRTAVYLSLALAVELLGAAIPETVLAQLRPTARKERALRNAINAAGLFHPKSRKFSNAAYIRFAALLYDNPRGLLRAVVPNKAWMKRQYGFQSSALLPIYHARRLCGLALHRVGI